MIHEEALYRVYVPLLLPLPFEFHCDPHQSMEHPDEISMEVSWSNFWTALVTAVCQPCSVFLKLVAYYDTSLQLVACYN